MAAAFEGKDRLKAKLSSIPAAIRKQVIPVMAAGADRVVALQKELVRVETPPGAHAKATRHEAAHGAGTEKASIEVEAKNGGLSLLISAIPSALPNLGRWLEWGTKPGTRGGSTARKVSRRGRIRFIARKVYRTHPGSRPYPFFFPPWHALAPQIVSDIKAAWANGLEALKAKG